MSSLWYFVLCNMFLSNTTEQLGTYKLYHPTHTGLVAKLVYLVIVFYLSLVFLKALGK